MAFTSFENTSFDDWVQNSERSWTFQKFRDTVASLSNAQRHLFFKRMLSHDNEATKKDEGAAFLADNLDGERKRLSPPLLLDDHSPADIDNALALLPEEEWQARATKTIRRVTLTGGKRPSDLSLEDGLEAGFLILATSKAHEDPMIASAKTLDSLEAMGFPSEITRSAGGTTVPADFYVGTVRTLVPALAKMQSNARLGLLARSSVGLIFSYGDLFSDAYLSYAFHANGQYAEAD